MQIISGGWHFSFLQSPIGHCYKNKSYSHGEFNKKEITDEKEIQSKIEKNEDIIWQGI